MFVLIDQQRPWLLRQVEIDTSFLQRLNVLDYSLLVAHQPLHQDERHQCLSFATLIMRTKKWVGFLFLYYFFLSLILSLCFSDIFRPQKWCNVEINIFPRSWSFFRTKPMTSRHVVTTNILLGYTITCITTTSNYLVFVTVNCGIFFRLAMLPHSWLLPSPL